MSLMTRLSRAESQADWSLLKCTLRSLTWHDFADALCFVICTVVDCLAIIFAPGVM